MDILFRVKEEEDPGQETAEGQKEFSITWPSGRTFKSLVDQLPPKPSTDKDAFSPVMAVMIGGSLIGLNEEIPDDLPQTCPVELVRLSDMEGYRIYVRTLIFLYTVCAKRVAGASRSVHILHSINGSLYTEIRKGQEPVVMTMDQILKIRSMMQEMIDKDLPIRRVRKSMGIIREYFRSQERTDLVYLSHFSVNEEGYLYQLDGQWDTFNGLLMTSTGGLKWFDLVPYKEGIIIRTPDRSAPHDLRRYRPQPRLFSAFTQSREWGQVAGVGNIGSLNMKVASGQIDQLIDMSEALQSKHLAEISSQIAARKSRLVLIAGPSSSGKTTFAQKLCIQLMAEGLRPHMISMDNYFKNRDQQPTDENGGSDFEGLDALDLDLFNQDMSRIMKGQTIEIPTFNFLSGQREYNGRTLTLGSKDLLIVEGIHCLNEEVSRDVAQDQKFKIYISAITTLNLDDHNRIPTTDCRLLRRIIRDNRHRGYSAAMTISRWESVRKGEEKNIFPFQEEADVFFNSALVYEPAVLKTYAEPLLFQITPDQPEYAEARRLLKFLSMILGAGSEHIPRTSLIREFIGGGIYHQ